MLNVVFLVLLLSLQSLVAHGAALRSKPRQPQIQNTHVEIKLTGEEMVEAGTLLMEKMPEIKSAMGVLAKQKAKNKIGQIPILGKIIKLKSKKKSKQKTKEEPGSDDDSEEGERSDDHSAKDEDSSEPSFSVVDELPDGVIGYKVAKMSKGMEIPKKITKN